MWYNIDRLKNKKNLIFSEEYFFTKIEKIKLWRMDFLRLMHI